MNRDITTLANSIAYITRLVSKNSDEVSAIKKELIAEIFENIYKACKE